MKFTKFRESSPADRGQEVEEAQRAAEHIGNRIRLPCRKAWPVGQEKVSRARVRRSADAIAGLWRGRYRRAKHGA
jgi:hypothetical protein